jgi:NTE family protein
VDPGRTADVVIGTSAGACVAAQITSPVGYPALLAAQRVPLEESRERMPDVDFERVVEIFGLLADPGEDPEASFRKVGKLALATRTVPEAVRREIIADRLPVQHWPERRLLITAVDVETGALRVFDRETGVSLVDAVAASCAVPGVWPPVTLEGRRYVDGGVRSPTHADLALGSETVLVLSPVPAEGFGHRLDAEREALRGRCVLLVVCADEEAQAAFGANPLDPATRGPALDAGLRQGAALAGTVGPLWGETP